MKAEIQQRIEQIRAGKVPDGYQQTKVGIIPNDWDTICVGDIAKINTGSKDTQDKIKNGKYPFFVRSQTMEKINSYSFDGEAILTAGDGVGVGKVIHYIDGKFNYHQRVYNIHNFDLEVLGQYFYHFFKQNFYKRIMRLSAKNSVDSVRMEMISKMIFLKPNFQEQIKINQILTTADTQIELKEKLIENENKLKKGLIQKLQKRNTWSHQKFKDVLFEHKENSTGKEEVHSVSVSKGVINQIEHLGRSYAAKDVSNYNLVKPYDIIYTKSPTGKFPYGIIKQSYIKKNVIISPLYGVFTPKNIYLGYILDVYFETENNVINYLKPIIQKGAKNTMNITNTTFLSRGIILPNAEEEQEKVGNLLIIYKYKINLLQKQLEQLKLQKKSLMQLLLTGIVRVKE